MKLYFVNGNLVNLIVMSLNAEPEFSKLQIKGQRNCFLSGPHAVGHTNEITFTTQRKLYT